jgi:DNA invertase Pin-like site-specific DNA recombinase
MTLAISYSRFSAARQGEGDSENRQDAAFIRFCERHGLKPAQESFIDRGRSGYHGEHLEGQLGQLIELAQQRRLPRNSVLVVEAWDRLGRLRPDRQIELISGLLRAGLRIGVCRLDEIFTERDFGSHKWTTLAVFAQLAFQESQQKSERVAHSWKSRKARARETGQAVTTGLPSWLRWHNGVMEPIPERAAVVRRIFQLAADGVGAARTVRMLNDEGVTTFTRKKRWSTAYVRLILNNRAVLGIYQPLRMDLKANGKRTRVPDGSPIPNYYPRIISEGEWSLSRRRGAPASKQSVYVNVFQSLLKNALLEDDTFILHNKGTAAKPHLLLISRAGPLSGQPQARFSYLIFEKAILHLLKEVPASVVAPIQSTLMTERFRNRLEELASDIAAMKESLRRRYSPNIAELLHEKEDEVEKVQSEYEQALAEELNPVARAWEDAQSLADVVRTDEDRLRLRAAFKRCISSITMLVQRKKLESCAFVDCKFKSGSSRLFVVWHKPPHFSGRGKWKDGFWWVMSTLPKTSIDLTSAEDQAFAAKFVASWQEPTDAPHGFVAGTMVQEVLKP